MPLLLFHKDNSPTTPPPLLSQFYDKSTRKRLNSTIFQYHGFHGFHKLKILNLTLFTYRHNDDGSYTYGYEAADGSYKIESKGSNGEVKGKYCYYDDAGQLREIEYGATKNGFNPTGTGINVPPPAAAANSINTYEKYDDNQDDGQYRPAQYETPYEYQPEQEQQQIQSPNFNFAPAQQPQQSLFQNQPIRPRQRQSNRARAFNNVNNQQQTYYQQPAQAQQQQYTQPAAPTYSNYNSAPALGPNVFQGHPASNINLNSGSYSINY